MSRNEPVWRAFYTRPRHEKKVAARLEEAGLTVYCPVYKTKVRWSDRWKKVSKPLFNGYVFACVDESGRIRVLEDPGVSRCVNWLGKPAVIRNEEIEAIRILLGEAEDVEIREFKPGDKVFVAEGALGGSPAELISVSGNRARLRIEALGREITATVRTANLIQDLP